jgi:hypothetical protein
MKKILFFTCEPGGAEMLAPVIRLVMRHKKHRVVVLGYGHGLKRFQQKEIPCTEIKPILQNDRAVIDAERPDVIVTSATSLPRFDMSEKYLWQNARQAGVKTFAFVDQWQNYALRFSGPSEQERLSYLPDVINCIDEIGKSEMVAEGFDEKILYPLGHPSLSLLQEEFKSVQLKDITLKPGFPAACDDPKNTVLFVSEALREHFGDSRGYDQYQVLDHFLQNISRSAPERCVLVKLHPKDEPTRYERLIAKYPGLGVHCIQHELTSLECIRAADVVFGMTSIMLVEAFILGRTVISVQPGLKGVDPLVLSRHGLIPLLRDYATFDVNGFHPADAKGLGIAFDEKRFMSLISS